MLDEYLNAVKEVNAATTKANELRASVSEARKELNIKKYGVDIALTVLIILYNNHYEFEARRLRDGCYGTTVINDESLGYANELLFEYGIGVYCDCILTNGDYSGTVKIFDVEMDNLFK